MAKKRVPLTRTQSREIDREMHNEENRITDRYFEHKRQISNAFFAGLDPRRRQEVADAGMVQEDPRAVANLSPNFVHQEYPKIKWSDTPFRDDME